MNEEERQDYTINFHFLSVEINGKKEKKEQR